MRTSDGPVSRGGHRRNELGEQLDELLPAWTRTNEHLARIRDELISTRGIVRAGAEARELANGVSARISFSAGQLAGFSVRETTGAAGAVLRFRDGQISEGGLLLTVSLNPGESTRDWFLPNGIGFVRGLSIEVVSGTIEGSVFLGPVES